MKTQFLICVFSLLWVFAGQASDAETFPEVEKTQLISLCYHDITRGKKPEDPFSVTVDELVKQFTWLAGNGYQPISLSRWNKAATSADLPEKPVLLTFDDGYTSFRQHVLPLLELFEFPAVLAPVTSWIDTPEGQPVSYGDELKPRDYFLTWDDLRDIATNELIELASHTHDLHNAQLGNPFGNELPSASVHIYDSQTDSYESDSDYLQRLENDLQTSRVLFETHLGKAPDTIVWPYGKYNRYANTVAAKLGMKNVLTLDNRPNTIGLPVVHRELMSSDTTLADLASIAQQIQDPIPLRSIYIDMDQLYEADPIRFAQKFDALLDQIKALAIGAVFVQAFSDVDKDGLAEALYFPNRHFPMRADLFNRVSWQLRTRADVAVYAWMPQAMSDVPSEDVGALGTSLPIVDYQAIVREIYDDLGKSSLFHGVLLDEQVHFSSPIPASPTSQTENSRVTSIGGPHSALNKQNFKAPDQSASELTQILRNWQPALVAIRSSTPLEPRQEEDEYLSALTRSLTHYNYITVSVNTDTQDDLNSQGSRLIELAGSLRQNNPEVFYKTVFQVRGRGIEPGSLISADVLKKLMDEMLSAGIGNIAYNPGDRMSNHAQMEVVRAQLSNNSFPARKE